MLNLNLLPDFYPLLRPFLFRMDAEQAHGLAIKAMQKGLTPRFPVETNPILKIEVGGLEFANPIGLAAGFDKHAEVMDQALGLGFGFVEAGSITPRPQIGNPKPRLFRIPEAEAVINRFGFNSEGFEEAFERLELYRSNKLDKIPGVLGINIGKNKDTVDAAVDYVEGVRKFKAHADYLTINISSPNTPGLRDLQGSAPLAELLKNVMDARDAGVAKPPVFVKIAPDQTEEQLQDIARVVMDSRITGVIVGNTTVSRPDNIPAAMAKEVGGLSGKPLFEMSTRVLNRMFKLTEGKVPLIGCGGVASGRDAYAKIRAGASLVQLYTALVYHGPYLIPRINRELAALLKADGFVSVRDAVGVDVA